MSSALVALLARTYMTPSAHNRFAFDALEDVEPLAVVRLGHTLIVPVISIVLMQPGSVVVYSIYSRVT